MKICPINPQNPESPNYKATYVARDLGEVAQVIHQIYMAGTEGES